MKKVFYCITLFVLIFLLACANEQKRDPNVLVVATAGDMPPFNYYDENNNLVGFDIDVANEIGKRLNKKVEFNIISSSRFVPMLTSNRIDMVVSALDRLPEIENIISYTEPYMYAITFFAVRGDNPDAKISSVYEVNGTDQLIGVTNGTYAVKHLKDDLGLGENMSIYPSRTDLYIALNSNKIIGILADEDELVFINNKLNKISENSSLKNASTNATAGKDYLRIADPANPDYDHYISIAVNKNNKQLLQQLNQIIKKMKEDGTLSKIGLKWLNREPFPRYAIKGKKSPNK